MQITRLFEKGRISDQDRIFYLSLLPNLAMTKSAATASLAELKKVLQEKVSSITNEVIANDGFQAGVQTQEIDQVVEFLGTNEQDIIQFLTEKGIPASQEAIEFVAQQSNINLTQ